jgi:hypothetical protein
MDIDQHGDTGLAYAHWARLHLMSEENVMYEKRDWVD